MDQIQFNVNHIIIGLTLNANLIICICSKTEIIYEDVTSSSRPNYENHLLENGSTINNSVMYVHSNLVDDNNLVEKTSRKQQHNII